MPILVAIHFCSYKNHVFFLPSLPHVSQKLPNLKSIKFFFLLCVPSSDHYSSRVCIHNSNEPALLRIVTTLCTPHQTPSIGPVSQSPPLTARLFTWMPFTGRMPLVEGNFLPRGLCLQWPARKGFTHSQWPMNVGLKQPRPFASGLWRNSYSRVPSGIRLKLDSIWVCSPPLLPCMIFW